MIFFLQTYRIYPEASPETASCEELLTALGQGGPYSTLSHSDRAAMEMNSAIIIWVDILGATCTGSRPRYGDQCVIGLGEDSRLQFQVVMGCRNWAIALVS